MAWRKWGWENKTGGRLQGPGEQGGAEGGGKCSPQETLGRPAGDWARGLTDMGDEEG